MIIFSSKFNYLCLVTCFILANLSESKIEATVKTMVMTRGQESPLRSTQLSQSPSAATTPTNDFSTRPAELSTPSYNLEKAQQPENASNDSTNQAQQSPQAAQASRYAPIEQVIRDQLKALREQDPSQAYYAYTSSEFQHVVPLVNFKVFVFNNTILSTQTNIEIEKTSFNGVMAVVKGRMVDANRRFARIEFDLIQENGGWKIRRIDLMSSPSTTPTSQ